MAASPLAILTVHPTLFTLELPIAGTWNQPTYGVFLALGACVGVLAVALLLRRAGRPLSHGALLALGCAFAGLVSGRVSHQLEGYLLGDPSYAASIEGLTQAAGSYHVGILFGIATGLALVRWMRLPFLASLDAIAIGSALGQGLGRIGCIFAGCCWGTPCDQPWGVVYPASTSSLTGVPHGVALHPVALYESAWLLTVALLLLTLPSLRRRRGSRCLAFLGAWAVGRFGLEFLRADPRVQLGPFSSPQLVALGLLASLLVLLPILLRGNAPSSDSHTPSA